MPTADTGQLPHDHGQDVDGVLASMPEALSFQRAADTFQMISDPTRLRIFWLLCHSELCVCNVAAGVGMSAPAVSHHLKMLKHSGLITSRRIGKEMHYRLASTAEAERVHQAVDEVFMIQCPVPPR